MWYWIVICFLIKLHYLYYLEFYFKYWRTIKWSHKLNVTLHVWSMDTLTQLNNSKAVCVWLLLWVNGGRECNETMLLLASVQAVAHELIHSFGLIDCWGNAQACVKEPVEWTRWWWAARLLITSLLRSPMSVCAFYLTTLRDVWRCFMFFLKDFCIG